MAHNTATAVPGDRVPFPVLFGPCMHMVHIYSGTCTYISFKKFSQGLEEGSVGKVLTSEVRRD